MVIETANLGLSKQANNENPGTWDVLERQDRDRLEARLTTQSAGDPNGLVAGYWIGQTCYDTSNDTVYRCTTIGDAATAVWSAAVFASTVAASNLSGTNTGDEVAATDTTAGVVELATVAETNTGTDTGRAIVPDVLAGSYAGTKTITFSQTDPTADVSVSDGKAYVLIPESLDGMHVVSAACSNVTAGVTGTQTVDIYNITKAVDIFSIPLTTATGVLKDDGTVVINTANALLTTGDWLRVDVTTIHTTTAAKGLVVVLEARKV